jgi:hypothetical protein
MPVQSLPRNPSLESLRNQARRLQRDVGASEAQAVARVREFHPRAEKALVSFRLTDAQLVTARTYGFASWPKLKAHCEAFARLRFEPGAEDGGSAADRFVRNACLHYGDWRPRRAVEAARALAADPELSRGDIFAAAAAGDVAAAEQMLARRPVLARARGGPHGWEPLLYASYSRMDGLAAGYSTLEVARRLVAAGGDPNAGFLWGGNVPPFTALTGAFGAGEDGVNQPPHPRSEALARLLLEAGADPNDGQTLYNRHFLPDDSHLRLLFEFGLGKDRGGPWYRLLGARLLSPAALLSEELWAAARRNFFERVQLLVAHGVDVAAPGFRDGRTPYEAALLAGNREIAEYLAGHGAREEPLVPADAFAAACVAGRGAGARALLDADPGLMERLGPHGRVTLVQRAVEAHRLEGVRLMAELGFEIGRTTRHDGVGMSLAATPMHNAAWIGDLEMVKLLVALGADPAARDGNYNATPRDWAERNGQTEVVEYLAGL